MRPSKNAWSTSEEARCVLLCAQLFEEMLGEFTFESFRVYSLGTLSRLNEAIDLIEEIQANRIPRETLDPVLDELLWSFGKDPIAKQSAAREIEALAEIVKQKYVLLDLLGSIRLIRRLLSWRYKIALEQWLLDLLAEPKRKIEMRQACGFYCSHLVNLGFSKQWISEQVQQVFFARDMSNAGRATLAEFFEKFGEEPSSFVVLTLISPELARYLPPLGFTVRMLSDISQQVQNALQAHNEVDMTFVLQTNEEAYDDYGAVISFQQQLTSIRAVTFLQPEPLVMRWSERMFVTRADNTEGRILCSPTLSFEKPSEKAMTGRRLRNHRNYFARVFEDFETRSTERLLSSINTAALARTSPNRENQLISLWSAIEVLLSDPPVGTPRIVSYVRQLTPCICLRHARRQFVTLFEELLVFYKRPFMQILKQEKDFTKTDSHTTFATALCLEENADLQAELCELCKDNPLALQRMFKLHRDYQTVSAAAHTIEGHRSRVEWQIHRIYRARNQLVHAGSVPSYLDSLILNMAEYYRASIATIINRARRDPNNSDIDQVVSEIAIEYGIFARHFRRKENDKFDRASLLRLVSVV